MKWLSVAVAALLLVVSGWGVVYFSKEKGVLKKEIYALQQEKEKLMNERNKLRARLQGLQNQENLLTELKSEFNYRSPDEQLFVIIPKTKATE